MHHTAPLRSSARGARARAASGVAAAGHRRVGVRDRVAGQRDGEGAGEAVAVAHGAAVARRVLDMIPSTGLCIQVCRDGAYYLSSSSAG